MTLRYTSFYILILLIVSCKNTHMENEVIETKSKLDLQNIDLSTWEISNSVRALEVVDENIVWYAGSNSLYSFTEDGGETWILDSLKVDNKSLEFRAIEVTEEAVFLLSIDSPTYLFKSIDKGENWKIVYQENDSLSFYNSLSFWDNQYGIATGDPIGGCLSIITTNDGGESWNKISCSQLPPTFEGEAEFAASNTNIALAGSHAWIVTGGSKARVFRSTDYGETWDVFDTPIISGG